jgi:hypothetical protein
MDIDRKSFIVNSNFSNVYSIDSFGKPNQFFFLFSLSSSIANIIVSSFVIAIEELA